MTWTNRLRLLGGVFGVILIVAVLTLIFNQRQTKVASVTATVAADTYQVGSAYGGTVIKQFVKDGQVVKAGDKLFTVASVNLQQDVSNGLEIESTDAYEVDAKAGTVTYKATVAGQVSDLQAKLGNAVANGSAFAKISVVGSQYVEARYLLSPRDYERVEKGGRASILLPDNRTIEGTVSTTEVATENGQALTDVRVDSEQLKDPDLERLTQAGTPLVVTLELRNDGWLAGPTDLVFNFLRQIGLK